MNNFIDDIIEKELCEGRVQKIRTRFPPEPNGYLHIGHAKSICLNFGTAIKYGGSCNLRFDDTNPLKEDEEYARAIIDDVKWLGFEGKVLYGSDYFEIMYEKAELLIKKGLAYVDFSDAGTIKQMRGTLTEAGEESPYRNTDREQNLALFRQMREGKFADGECTLRAKIDMSSPNINMRDPVLYRVLSIAHYRAGDKWKIYPMYDFAHPIQDAIEQITHSICTLEFEAHRPLYDWVVRECEFDPAPRQFEFARLEMTNTIMSKRFLKRLVDDGVVDGWDDPRMPTLSGLRRRGFPAEAIREFCARIGVSKANSTVDYRLLEACVRDQLNATARRVMCVFDPLRLELVNLKEPIEIELDNSPAEGARKVVLGKTIFIEKSDFAVNPPPKYHRLVPDGMVRLKGAYIIKAESYETDESGEVTLVRASIVEGTMSGQESGIKVKGVIHFADEQTAEDITVNNYESLLCGGDGDFADRLNPNSKTTFTAKCERGLRSAVAGERFQFLRQGYYAKDAKTGEFNMIVSLKDTYKP